MGGKNTGGARVSLPRPDTPRTDKPVMMRISRDARTRLKMAALAQQVTLETFVEWFVLENATVKKEIQDIIDSPASGRKIGEG